MHPPAGTELVARVSRLNLRLRLIAAFAAGVLAVGCGAFVADPGYRATQLPDDVTELFEVQPVVANPDADTVWVFEQGGPSHEISNDVLFAFLRFRGHEDIHLVQAHQTLTLVYATAESTGYGNPPQLLLSRPDFTHELSSALADAVAAHRHSLGPDLHLKSATIGDIECADLVVSGSRHDYPFVYRRVGDSFKLQDRPLTTNNGYAADVNGDGAVDFVSLPGGTDVEVLLNRQ